MSITESMREDWDARARENAFHYIASWRGDWDEASFFASGAEDYQKLVAPFLTQLGVEPRTLAMLEVGCGAGRMTRAFAAHFQSVIAFDVSPEMQKQARIHLREFPQVRFITGDGATLAGVESESVDFVFSYLVLQHLPKEALALGFVREMMRVLKPGGALLFQFNSAERPTMNWKGRAAWGFVDGLWAAGLKRASQFAASLLHLDPQIAGKSWRGARVDSRKVAAVMAEAGAGAVAFEGEATPMTWCRARKT
jgi:ubiquinone/menaquinone biosynthesis C-methylase UbiE